MAYSEYTMRQFIDVLRNLAENAEEILGSQPLTEDLYISFVLSANGRAPTVRIQREYTVSPRSQTEE